MERPSRLRLELRDALVRYFDTLEAVGMASPGAEFRLLAMDFALETLEGEAEWYVTDDDYEALRRLLALVHGDCLVPYAAYCDRRVKVGDPRVVRQFSPRMKEDGATFRKVERGDRFRITEKRIDE